VYLKIGLAAVLVWVGVKLLLIDVFYIPTTVSLAVVALLIGASIVASLVATRGEGRRAFEDARRGTEQVE
jgi:tellurite resistance protein TerC